MLHLGALGWKVPYSSTTSRVSGLVVVMLVLIKLPPSSHRSVGNQFVQYKYFRHHKC